MLERSNKTIASVSTINITSRRRQRISDHVPSVRGSKAKSREEAMDETLQREYKINIAGPTTMRAL